MQVLLISIALFPLIVTNSTFFPTVFGKALYIRTLITMVTILFTTYFSYSSEFRVSIVAKINDLKKNRIVQAISAYFVIFSISTALATDKFISFWGSPERNEGWVGIFFYILFFFLIIFLFEKKHWIWFLRTSVLIGIVTFIHMMYQFFTGSARPDSLSGNVALLSTYLLFFTFCSFWLFLKSNQERNRLWLWISGLAIPASIISIFLDGTRGAIVGLAAGILASLIYLALRGENIFFKNFSLKRISAGLLLLVVVFSGTFILTRKAEIWSKVPGLNRIALISASDPTTHSRLILAKISLNAINPANEGIKKFLFGWGWDNFKLAWQKYYDPALYFYDQAVFDRAHDKIFDVLVMNGILGLLAYLAIWFFFFRTIFRLGGFSTPILLFFGTAFFVQNLFLFDHVMSWVPFFAVLGYATYLSIRSNKIYENSN